MKTVTNVCNLTEENSSSKNIDRIDEAYNGSLGQELMEGSRARINWICSQAKGELILDVGCSQGTASIILGREGKSVTGIDICEESIKYALALLDFEDESTRNSVDFVNADFIGYTKDKQHTYDSIIMGEVLEHISDPDRLIYRAYEILSDEGIFVVTVPFGINDYHDHKRTYYMIEIYDSLATHFSIKDVDFLGSWIGLVCSKKAENDVKLDRELFSQVEKAFYLHERKLLNTISSLKKDRDALNNQMKAKEDKYTESVMSWKGKYEELNNLYQEQISLNYKQKEELRKMERRYVDLANSKLGKLQLKIWESRHKREN